MRNVQVRGFLLNFGVYSAGRAALGLPFQWSPAIVCVPSARPEHALIRCYCLCSKGVSLSKQASTSTGVRCQDGH